jgi:trypsin
MMRKLLLTCAIAAIALVAAQPVAAVNGPLDGNAHPNVGVMLVLDGDGELFEYCGGVLISPTVFLTNHNCPGAVEFARSIGGRAVITFEPILPWPPEGQAFREVQAGYIHPEANPQKVSNLYGIAILAEPVVGVVPAQLPTLHRMASIGKRDAVTIVGYGDNSRRSASVAIGKVDPAMFSLLSNSKATGLGGVCGDGGSPSFLEGTNIVVGVADGQVGRCNAISWAFRTDIETARSFIDDFVSVP